MITTNVTKRRKVIRTAAIPASLYGLLKGQLRFLNNTYEIVGVASDDSLMKDLEKREGIRTIGVNIERNISPVKDLISVYKLYRLFLEEKPFMVHSITPKAGLLSMTAAYFARVPKRAHTFTGLIFPTQKGIMKRLLIFFDKLICLFATNIYPEGNGVKNDLINYGITNKKLKVLANGNVNGVDLIKFNPSNYTEKDNSILKNNLKLNSEDIIFIFIGRLVNDKGINELIQAFKKLLESHDNITLLLVGSDYGEVDILPKSTWETIKSQTKIKCLGQQADVRPYLAISDVFVFPSYREGFPNVVLEAGAMGLPSIVTDINGSNEIIKHEENGLIVPSKDVSELFEAMIKMVSEPGLIKKLSIKSRLNIEKNYERSFVWKELLKEYQQIESQLIKD